MKDSSGQRGPGDDSATAIAAAFANEPGRPALAAITVPYSDDPDSWHVTPGLPPKILAALRAQFRKRYPSLCEGRGDEVGVAPQDPFDYSNEDIKLVAGYISGKGWLLARLRLDEVVDCGRDDSGYGIDDAWYAVRPDGAVIYLDSGLELVDIGDYDHDGSSELLFRLSRYNIRGYELYYRNFSRQAANLYLAY